MIHSMTAFARTQKLVEAGHLCWEIRSVNHRYLDISFRLPESFRFLESTLRSTFRDKIHRGKLECHLKYHDTNSNNQSMLINKGIVNALIDLSGQLSTSYNLADDLTASKVLSWPGVIQVNQIDLDELGQQALELFRDSVEQLEQVRLVEGKALRGCIEERLALLEKELHCSKAFVVSLAHQTKDKLLSRLHTVRMEIPESRVEQEIALILTRLDVSEELDRLQTHIKEMGRTLQCDKVAGKRLDFLLQELNREANTLCSKSDSTQLTQSAIEMKVLIEQMREQVQNIE
jgi:uncharacterized protein (TIGR00255 family)